MQRQQSMTQWLIASLGHDAFEIEVASADASFRRYFRVQQADRDSLIVMDAPPDKEDCRPFLKIQGLLKRHHVPVPEVLAFDSQHGFMLLSDLGNTQMLRLLNDENYLRLYQHAITTIHQIQQVDDWDGVPIYDETLLNTEMDLFLDWFIGHHLGITLDQSDLSVFTAAKQCLIENALNQTQVLVHRDFHSRNLMWQGNQDGTSGEVGVIDFQDAVIGAETYDLVSLLKDCYIEWTDEQLKPLLMGFYEQKRHPSDDFDSFRKQLDLMGAQRHLKAIGIFCRLNYRDSKVTYLNDIPLTMRHLLKACQKHTELHALADLVNRILPKLKTP